MISVTVDVEFAGFVPLTQFRQRDRHKILAVALAKIIYGRSPVVRRFRAGDLGFEAPAAASEHLCFRLGYARRIAAPGCRVESPCRLEAVENVALSSNGVTGSIDTMISHTAEIFSYMPMRSVDLENFIRACPLTWRSRLEIGAVRLGLSLVSWPRCRAKQSLALVACTTRQIPRLLGCSSRQRQARR